MSSTGKNVAKFSSLSTGTTRQNNGIRDRGYNLQQQIASEAA